MKAIILAGGLGTRLKSIAGDLPKPMVPIGGKPILEYQIESLKKSGFTEIFLMTGYQGDRIQEYFGDGSAFGVSLDYFRESYPMGTAGALSFVKDIVEDDVCILMGDLLLDVDFRRFEEAHRASGALVTLFVHPNSHPFDSDLVVTKETGSAEDFSKERCGLSAREAYVNPETGLTRPVTGIIGKKEERSGTYRNLVNAGLYFLKKEVFRSIPLPMGGKVDLDKDVIRPLIAKGQVAAYHSTEYVKDVGTPERYEQGGRDLAGGIVEARSLRNLQKCIFLDRDGTLNKARGFISRKEDLVLEDRAAEAVRRINASEYLVVMITNQPVIARGEISFEGLEELHERLEVLLGEQGAYLDGILYCPHHPDSGFDGEVKELKFPCCCRKPDTGMIERAAALYRIDLSASWFAGDMTMDVECGRRAGLKTVLLSTGYGGEDGKFDAEPDLRAADLAEAAELILGQDGRSVF